MEAVGCSGPNFILGVKPVVENSKTIDPIFEAVLHLHLILLSRNPIADLSSMVFTVFGGVGSSISDRFMTKPDTTMKAGSSVLFLASLGLEPAKTGLFLQTNFFLKNRLQQNN